MADFYQLVDNKSQEDQLLVLRGILQRIAQGENPEKFSLIKQVVSQRIADLEEEAKHTPDAV